MPPRSSAGWFGCRRMPSTPCSPSVLRQRVTLRILAAASTRSLLLINLATAAAISGVTARRNFVEPGLVGGVVEQPLAKLAHRERRQRGERRGVVRVENQPGDFVALGIDDRLGQDLA